MALSNGALDQAPQNIKSKLKAKSRARRDAFSAQSGPQGFRSARRNDISPLLALTETPIAQLRPPARETRKIAAGHVKEVADSISALGFCVPVLVGQGDRVLDGWVRVQAAKALGLDRVPCVRVDHLTEAEQRLLRIAVNRLGEKGEWDVDALRLEFEELILEEAPIEVSGFTFDEIDHILLSEADQAIERGPLAPEPQAMAVARIGDVFVLGAHRIVCGSAADPEVLSRLIAGDPGARLVLTDEPYNVPIAGHVTSGRHREFAMASGEMSDAEFLAFNEAWIAAAMPCLCDGGILATFIDWRGYPTVSAAANKLSLKPLNLIVWAKTNAGMGSSTAPSMNSCRCSRKGPRHSSITSNWADAAAGARTSGPIRGRHRSVLTLAEALRITRPSSQLPCSRTRSSISPIGGTSSSTHSLAPARPSSPQIRPDGFAEASSSIRSTSM
jgi:ParB-like nuclease domain/DNA methylase